MGCCCTKGRRDTAVQTLPEEPPPPPSPPPKLQLPPRDSRQEWWYADVKKYAKNVGAGLDESEQQLAEAKQASIFEESNSFWPRTPATFTDWKDRSESRISSMSTRDAKPGTYAEFPKQHSQESTTINSFVRILDAESVAYSEFQTQPLPGSTPVIEKTVHVEMRCSK